MMSTGRGRHDPKRTRLRYTTWVERVFKALQDAGGTRSGAGVSLAAVGHEVGVDGLSWEDFRDHEGVAAALFTAMQDLAAIGLVNFENVEFGNHLA
jgi:hypothetical protein